MDDRTKKKRVSSIYTFNIFELEKDEGGNRNDIVQISSKANNHTTYKSASILMRRRKHKEEKLSPQLLEFKKKLTRLYSLYECCYFLYMFKVDTKSVNSLFKNFNFSSKSGIKNMEDIICIYDEECFIEIKNSWLLSLTKRIELHEKLFNFLKYAEKIQNKY